MHHELGLTDKDIGLKLKNKRQNLITQDVLLPVA